MNEQFVNELATALRKVGTIHTVGEEWVSYIGEIPVGGVPYCGQMCTRTTYSALWSYAQAKGLVKTEAEWQQIASANNGNVPFYSNGDGSTTFRMPKMVGYVKGASSQSVAGDYVAEGLPNIEGNLTTENAPDYNFISDASSGQIGESGAFYISKWTNKYVTSKGGTSLYSPVALDFNASYSNPIYGASNHVTPETSTVLFGVYAFGAIVESGELDATTLATGLAGVESELGNMLPLSGGTMYGEIAQTVGDFIRCEYTNKYTSIKGGTNDTNGGSVTVYGKNHATNAGEVVITACDGTYTKSLNAKPDGSLTWGGSNVVRSVNGTNADASGDVTVTTGDVWTKVSSISSSVSKNTEKTITISGLTPNKIAYIFNYKFTANSGSSQLYAKGGSVNEFQVSNLYAHHVIESTESVYGFGSSNYAGTTSSATSFVPKGTTVTLYNKPTASGTVTFDVYQ